VSKTRLTGARRLIAAAATGLLVATVVTSTNGAQAQPAASAGSQKQAASSYHKQSYKAGNYIVLMAGRPAAVYHGGVQGYAPSGATRTAKYDSTTRAAQAYRELLTDRQTAAASSVGARPYYHYANALNGFAAHLSSSQARQLSVRDGVLAVVPDYIAEADTTHTPSFLGLTGPAGVWRRLGGTDSVNGAGKGIIIGIIDSGINDESEVFDAVGDGVPADWHGVCDHGTDDSFQCNDKLIGGRYFDEAATVIPEEFPSPDDFHGHGTHVAATAAGNYGVHSVINGIDFGATSGMAPAAKVAAYKVCWEKADHSNCSAASSDSVAAIDSAVSDGVDVLNYSIGGTQDNPIDPVELAYMYAADAGVFVANSAGNDGPTASTVEHPSPWLTTVAAATHINYESTVLLGDGTRMVGASISPDGVDESPLVYSGDVAADGADPDEANLCFPDTLDPAKVDGTIVICDRGVNDRVEKSAVVKDAGGVGMVLVNVTPNSLNSDVHSVPTVHLQNTYRAALLAYAETADPTASILAGENAGSTTPVPPAIAGFSSRGPSLVADGDLLKPDIAAPGVDVNAATAPEGGIGNGNDFAIISGTSMASPHIAGLAALILQKHPNWGPMEVKSAMMTTARDLTDTKNPFDQGAGFVVPREFMDPGLVYNSDFDDWSNYLAGQGVVYGDGTPFTDTPMKASNLNVPSIAVNNMAGKETVKRSVTNVDDTTSTYRAKVTGLPGLSTTVTPSTLTLAPGETGSFKVTFTRTTADFGDYQSGNLTWRDGSHIVRSPIVVSPSGVDAPVEVTVPGSTFKLTTKAGFDGTMGRKIRGLVAGEDTAAEADNSGGAGDPLDESNYVQPIEVTGPNATVRVQTLPDFPSDDLDLFLLDADDNIVALSATGASAETFTTSGLPAGEYRIVVEAFAVHNSEPSTTFTVRTFQVGANAGNLTVTPKTRSVQAGQKYTWQGTLSGLDPDTAYLGEVRWYDQTGGTKTRVGSTLISVDD
jgi:subtilisin family serine protease